MIPRSWSNLTQLEKLTGQVVVQLGDLLFGKVANGMMAALSGGVPRLLSILGQEVEKEWLSVVVERLVVQEQLREKAQVLAVDPLDGTIDLPERQLLDCWAFE